MNHQTYRRPRGWLVACAGIAVLLAGCETPYSRPPGTYGAPPPGRAGTAPAISNMGCVQAGSVHFARPWQTIVLGGSRRVDSGVYEVELTSGSDGRRAICTVDRNGAVLGVGDYWAR